MAWCAMCDMQSRADIVPMASVLIGGIDFQMNNFWFINLMQNQIPFMYSTHYTLNGFSFTRKWKCGVSGNWIIH